MFSLDGSMRYLLYNRPTDMRKSYHTLCGIVNNVLSRDPYNGDVYIFINKPRNRIKLLHWEPGGLVLYSKMLERGTFGRCPKAGREQETALLEWDDLARIVEDVLTHPGQGKRGQRCPKKG